MFAIIVAISLLVSISIVFATFYFEFLFSRKDSITAEERRVLMTISSKFRDDMLHYLRTYEASRQLQDEIAKNVSCLNAVSTFFASKDKLK